MKKKEKPLFCFFLKIMDPDKLFHQGLVSENGWLREQLEGGPGDPGGDLIRGYLHYLENASIKINTLFCV